MPSLQLGQRVTSAEFGPGIVRGITPRGTIRVHFELTDTTEAVDAASLRYEHAASVGPDRNKAVAPIPLRNVVITAERGDERRLAVECLRQGLPPPGKLTSWTFGHQRARRAVDAAVQTAIRGTGAVLIVRAAYGQGKSHLGRLGRELAHEARFATMHVELDGAGLSLRDGTAVVAALFASARLPPAASGDSDHLIPGLATVLRRAALAGRGGLPSSLNLFEPFLENPSRWVESEPAVEVLERYLSGALNRTDSAGQLTKLIGEAIGLPSLGMGYGTVSARQRAQAEQLGRVADLAALAGAKGTFIVIDELDHDVPNDEQGRISDMLAELARIARRRKMVLLLLTLAQEGDDGLSVPGAQEIPLDPLRDDEVDSLVTKAVETYAAAFPFPGAHNGRADLIRRLREEFRREYGKSGWGPRYFVRASIEACEAARVQGATSLADVRVR